MPAENSKETPFYVVEDRPVSLVSLAEERLGRLLKYWHKKRGNGLLPIGASIDPVELREHLMRLHIITVGGLGKFRYQLYGAGVTNPDLADMTGKLTTEYQDTVFGDLVTKHLAECVEAAAPICREIIAVKNSLPYSYRRLALPWSSDGVAVSKIMVSPERIMIAEEFDRNEGRKPFAR